MQRNITIAIISTIFLTFLKNAHSVTAESVRTEALKKRYLESSQDDSAQVVQKRLYSKKRKVNFSLLTSNYAADAFLTTVMVSGTIGFSFSNVFGIEAAYLQAFSWDSSAQKFLMAQTGNIFANTNSIQRIIGGQFVVNLLYGKLSFFGLKIFHFDFYSFIGTGQMLTRQFYRNDKTIYCDQYIWVLPWIGIGQDLYLTKFLSLRFEARFLFYNEKIYLQSSPELPEAPSVSPRPVVGALIGGGINFLF